MINLSKVSIGNEQLLKKLTDSFKNKTFSNSTILTAPKGTGKATFALNFICNILSSNKLNKVSTNLIYNNSHPNIKYLSIEFDEKNNKFKNNITIDQIRNLENFLYQSSFNNLPKFIIIDTADDLNSNSANSILKMLEEPKNNSYFILLSNNISNLLPTIRSRCVKFNINKPNKTEFNQILNLYNDNFETDNINFLYELSNGSPGIAIKIDIEKLNELYSFIIKIIVDEKNILSNDLIQLSEIVSNFSKDEFEIFLILLRFIIMKIVKNNLGILDNNEYSSFLLKDIFNMSVNIDNKFLFNILDFLNMNEKDLIIYNLDKKIFCLNIFTPSKYRL